MGLPDDDTGVSPSAGAASPLSAGASVEAAALAAGATGAAGAGGRGATGRGAVGGAEAGAAAVGGLAAGGLATGVGSSRRIGGNWAPLDRTTGRGGVAATGGRGSAAGAGGSGEGGGAAGVAAGAAGTGTAGGAATGSGVGSGTEGVSAASASVATGFAATFLAAAFLAGAFLTGAGSSGCSSRTRPSRSALRRTRSAWASSILDECVLTPMPRSTARSRVSLFVRPSSFASSWTRIFAANVGSPAFCGSGAWVFSLGLPGQWLSSLAQAGCDARSGIKTQVGDRAVRGAIPRCTAAGPWNERREQTHQYGRPAQSILETTGKARRHVQEGYGRPATLCRRSAQPGSDPRHHESDDTRCRSGGVSRPSQV